MEKLSCYHCGDECSTDTIVKDEHHFCCTGCKTVYEILSENELCAYYDLETSPGIRIESEALGDRFAFLENEDIKKELLDFSDSGISKLSFFLPQIHCSSCIWLLENLHKLHPSIIQSQVHFSEKKIHISYRDEEISLRKIAELLSSLGYEPAISSDGKPGTKQNPNRKLAIQIGVAGFCFGNIMLMSFPEYFGDETFVSSEFRLFFGWANLALSIPVLLFSGKDYLISAWKVLQYRSVNIDVPIAIGMLALFFRSAWEILSGEGAGYMDSLAGLVFFLLIGKWFQNKTYSALSYERDYRSYFPMGVTRVNGTRQESIPIREIEENDRILIRNQEVIPADSILLSNEALIDYSFVTGESEPILKKQGELIFAGGRQTGTSIELLVRRKVDQSYLTQLWNQDNYRKDESGRLAGIIDRVARRFTFIIMGIALITGITWLVLDPSVAVNAVTAVLIIACPCALALSIPFTFGNAVRWLGRSGLYLKNHRVVEDMAGIDHVVFDKTGTITQSKNVSVMFEGKDLNQPQEILLRSAAQHSLHPLSQAIYRHLQCEVMNPDSFDEKPGEGISARFGNRVVRLGSPRFILGHSAQAATGSMQVYAEIDGKFLGKFNIGKGFRSGLRPLTAALKKEHTIHLVSGDNDADRIALAGWFADEERMQFSCSPMDKLNYIAAIQDSGGRAMMLGDGLNDAGALRQANTGVAVADNVYAFSPACDAILDARAFGQLDKMIRFSHSALRIVRQSFVISFLYNSVGLYFAVQGMLTPLVAAILMPLSSITVIFFATIRSNQAYKRLGLKDLTEI